MSVCPQCELPMVASPVGTLWCSVWGRHAATYAALLIEADEELHAPDYGVRGPDRRLRAVG